MDVIGEDEDEVEDQVINDNSSSENNRKTRRVKTRCEFVKIKPILLVTKI